MKTLLVLLSLLFAVAPSFARGGGHGGSRGHASSSKASKGDRVHVRGYMKKNGTHVAPHVRSRPNKTKADNYSTKGNVNPETGKPGTKNP